MPPPILSEEEIQDNKQMREFVDDFIQLYIRTNNRETNNTEARTHLDLLGRSDIIYYIIPDEHSKADHSGPKRHDASRVGRCG